ncbi:hypothetical protein ACFC06_27970 [Nocardia sp. NPDC056064]|uniref:hypothetical protein n=1 Tax=Nocardia sp. NPDC056064 TaxID=3345701 RepID=UPI0035D7C528
MSTTLATAALTALTLCVGAGTGHAEPAPPQTDVRYEVSRQGDAAVVTTDGTMRIVDGQLVITTADEVPVAALPLSYRMDDTVFPIAATVDGGTATLTPSRDGGTPVAAATDLITQDAAVRQVAESFTPRDQTALGMFTQRLTIGSAVSAIIGAVLGGGIGCLVGGAAGAAIASPVIVLLVPWVGATVAGCVLGAATLGAVGTMVGLITVGGPLALFSAYQYFSTILAPCPAELGAYCKDPAVPAPAK